MPLDHFLIFSRSAFLQSLGNLLPLIFAFALGAVLGYGGNIWLEQISMSATNENRPNIADSNIRQDSNQFSLPTPSSDASSMTESVIPSPFSVSPSTQVTSDTNSFDFQDMPLSAWNRYVDSFTSYSFIYPPYLQIAYLPLDSHHEGSHVYGLFSSQTARDECVSQVMSNYSYANECMKNSQLIEIGFVGEMSYSEYLNRFPQASISTFADKTGREWTIIDSNSDQLKTIETSVSVPKGRLVIRHVWLGQGLDQSSFINNIEFAKVISQSIRLEKDK